MRGAMLVLATAVVLAGCGADELHVGMVPLLRVSTPPSAPASDDYIGVSFGTHWDLAGIEVTTGTKVTDGELWNDGMSNMTTVAASLWLGWHLTKGQNENAKAWLVLRPTVGVYYWEDAADPFGVMTGIRAGLGVHINEFNTIGLEYGITSLVGTHANDDSTTQGLNYTYTIVF